MAQLLGQKFLKQQTVDDTDNLTPEEEKEFFKLHDLTLTVPGTTCLFAYAPDRKAWYLFGRGEGWCGSSWVTDDFYAETKLQALNDAYAYIKKRWGV